MKAILRSLRAFAVSFFQSTSRSTAFFVVVAGLFVLIVGGHDKTPSHATERIGENRKPMTEREKYWYAAQWAVQQKLKAPDSAEFCEMGDRGAGVDDELGEAARVWGWVIAEDDLGAKSRITWESLITHEKDGWRPIMLRVGEKRYGLGGRGWDK